MGEYDHAAWQLAILKWFLQHEREWNIRVLPGTADAGRGDTISGFPM